ncbi:hypothetical protein CAPTEDRAFT_147983 [Capitella teleta]|uniref:ADF-H domain-containing protein n=1 Tax=Capitella teleta TaxID=283909 RepID=R7U2H7_CAPTE|nr:hypothetical protein CAPTEDRAFT_147983 [Capitella teleta]|eukprot:ELT97365.1 hypothetical protein CAPTEDRAFT_147983 [Capitella teleta]
MAGNLTVCSLDDNLKAKLKAFRFRKGTDNAAIVMKVDLKTQYIIVEEEYEDVSLDELQEELPSSQPRFIAYSYCYSHDDGRKSFPLCFFYITPVGCKPEQNMMYAGSMKNLVTEGGFTKVFEVRNMDDLTEEWLLEKLKFFK